MSESIWNDPRITAYVLDELTADERADFERAMNSNPELAAAVAEVSGLTSQLSDLYLSEATPGLDPKRREAILTADSNDASTTVASPSSWRLPLAVMATAATLLILLGIAPRIAERNSKIAMHDVQESTATNSNVLRGELTEGPADSEFAATTDEVLRPETDAMSDASGRDIASKAEKGLGSLPARDQSIAQKSKLETEEVGQSNFRADLPLKRRATSSALKESQIRQRSSGESAGAIRNEMPVNEPVPADRFGMSSGTFQTNEPARKSNAREMSGVATVAADVITLDSSIAAKDDYAVAESIMVDAVAPSPVPASPMPATPFGTEESNVALHPEPADAKFGRGFQVAQTERVAGKDSAGRYLGLDGARLPVYGFDGSPKQEGESVDFGDAVSLGTGPGKSGDQFEPITDNAFKRVNEHPLSTFSVDVDTASYSKTRDFLLRANQLPRPDAVRIEELINYFDYDYAGPDSNADHPFAARAVVTGCPWNEEHRLARIAIKGKEMTSSDRPKCNLVFLIDTSGSMNAPNKLPLVQQGMELLLDRLNKKDRVAIVVYAGSAGLVLDSTKVGKNGKEIKHALSRLSAGGSTNGGAGIALAYQTARENFITDGVNRVLLCTDGDFNVGTTGTDALVRMVEQEAKDGVFLSVLGFGMGNHNDAMLEKISGRGNGNYAFIDTQSEARKVLVEQTNATLVTIAKDVKLQIEFNPSKVSSYRLIGYENRILAKEDFNDDKKDAGEIGAGHEVTALYEIVPVGATVNESVPQVDPLKYQTELKPTDAADSDEMLTVKLRYKQPDGDKSTLVDFPVRDDGQSFGEADYDVRFAAAVAGFGMQLRHSEYKGNWMLKDVLSVAQDAIGEDEFGLKEEFMTLVRKASELMGQQ